MSWHSPETAQSVGTEQLSRTGDPYAVRIQRKGSPPISIYVVITATPIFAKLSCMFCKRTVVETNLDIAKIVTAPMPLEEFDSAQEIQCSLCSQKYRLLRI